MVLARQDLHCPSENPDCLGRMQPHLNKLLVKTEEVGRVSDPRREGKRYRDKGPSEGCKGAEGAALPKDKRAHANSNSPYDGFHSSTKHEKHVK